MSKKVSSSDPIRERLDGILDAVQDLFILQALTAGMNADDVRKILRLDKWRITNISKHLKRRRGGAKKN